MTKPLVVPVVLAAGAGQRMGGCKALCDFDGTSALDLVLAACRGAGAGAPIVVLGAQAEQVRAAMQGTGPDPVTFVVNPNPERGQTSSLQVGLRVLSDDAAAFLIFPVDFPLVDAREVGRLIEDFTDRCARDDVPQVIALSHLRRRGHPVLVSRSLVASLLALPDGGSARDVLNGSAVLLRTFYIETDNPVVVWDMDTPADYQRLLVAYRARSG